MFKNNPNHNYFEQQFSESEGNIQEHITYNREYKDHASTYNPNKQTYNQSDEVPLQLVKLEQNGKFQINYDAIDLINSYNKPVGIVCLAGKYRTGKSFLLNKLLDLQGDGFRVDSSTSACTEGIWMWSKPIYNHKEDCYLFFIDTQGSESTNRNADHDAKIFTLGILVSSYFIYNSVGAIDETSINQLNLVTSLTKNIIVSEDNNEENIHRYMPKFLWLLRDFVLEINNEYGEPITPEQYLQNSLFEQNSQIKSDYQVRNIRRAMVNVFRDRDCMMLVRPTGSEDDLKRLNTLPNSRLRPEFLAGVSTLKNKIMSGAGPKMINGEKTNSLILTELIIAYVNDINNKGIPNIISAWQHLGEQAALDAYDDALDAYNDKYEEHFSVDEPKGEEIHAILKQMRDEALDTYDYGLESPNERVRSKLKTLIAEKEKAIIEVNNQLNEARNVQVLRDCSHVLMRNLELGKYSAENPKILIDDTNDMINQYNAKAVGPLKCEVLSKFLTNFNPIVMKSYTQTTRNKIASNFQEMGAANQMKVQYEREINILQQRIRSIQNQATSVGNVNNAQASEELFQARMEAERLKKQLEAHNNKQQGQKCCLLF